MRKTLSFAIFLLFAKLFYAQSVDTTSKAGDPFAIQPQSTISKPFSGLIFAAVKHPPTYPGGIAKLNKYRCKLKSHEQYRKRKVIVNFVVERDDCLDI